MFEKPGSRSSGMTVRVHALESDFPSCCWEVNDLRKNITYDVFEAHGGVDVDADAPLDSWLDTPARINPNSNQNWWTLNFNVTLDERTRAALASGGGGHIGFAISNDMVKNGWIVSRDHGWDEHHPRLTVYAGAASTSSPAPTASRADDFHEAPPEPPENIMILTLRNYIQGLVIWTI